MSERRTLGDLGVPELLSSAGVELICLGEAIARLEGVLTATERLVLGAYVGSIGARIAVAEMKLEESTADA